MVWDITATDHKFPLKSAFRIARGAKTHAHSIIANVTDPATGYSGYGEATPYARYGENVASVLNAINNGAPLLTGAAANAVDCAKWDLQAKLNNKPVWQQLNLPEPTPVQTAVTLSLAAPTEMAVEAKRLAKFPLLKLKLAGDGMDGDRLKAVRDQAPAPQLILDGNEGFTISSLEKLLPDLVQANIALVEQPLPAGKDDTLASLRGTIPFCADESVHTVDDLPRLKPLYDAVNIKLDKAGGLSPALSLAKAAKADGFSIMIGCMVASSRAMAPALLLASFADFVDLDGPLFLVEDCPHGLTYNGAMIPPASPNLWGFPCPN
ncbi:MAG: dipeptide epimerase [Alphaproteobacteria bacterium]